MKWSGSILVQTTCILFWGTPSSQFQIQRRFHGFHGTPLLKGCLRKYYAQMYHVHYAHTGATHFSFNSSNNTHVSSPVSRIRRAHGLRARIYYHKHVATLETMSKASEQIKAYSCIAPSAAKDANMLSV